MPTFINPSDKTLINLDHISDIICADNIGVKKPEIQFFYAYSEAESFRSMMFESIKQRDHAFKEIKAIHWGKELSE